jgi:hypothetical protein
MNRLTRQLWLPALLALLAAPAPSLADERRVAPPEQAPQALLLPAVQKAQADEKDAAQQTAPRSVQPAPQRGIEPDELNVASPPRSDNAQPSARGVERSSAPATRGAQRASVQEMMVKLRAPQPAAAPPRARTGASSSGPASVQAKPPEPPKYEIADCGTATSPMICCHHEKGDGSSCNLFKILCKNAGGTAQGDGESAACSDW